MPTDMLSELQANILVQVQRKSMSTTVFQLQAIEVPSSDCLLQTVSILSNFQLIRWKMALHSFDQLDKGASRIWSKTRSSNVKWIQQEGGENTIFHTNHPFLHKIDPLLSLALSCLALLFDFCL